MFAVHNLYARAAETDPAGTMTLDGKTRIQLPEPLMTFDSFEEAEEWRVKQLGETKGNTA